MKQEVDVDFDIIKFQNELLTKTRKSLHRKLKEETYIAFKNYDLLLGVLIMSLGTKKALNHISNICNQMKKKITKNEASSLAKKFQQNKNAIHFNHEGIKNGIEDKTTDELQTILKAIDKTRKVHIVYVADEETKYLVEGVESNDRIYIYKCKDFYLLGVYEVDGKIVQTDVEEPKPQKKEEKEQNMQMREQEPKKEKEEQLHPQPGSQKESIWFQMLMVVLIVLIILMDNQVIDLSFLREYHEFYVLKTANRVIEFLTN